MFFISVQIKIYFMRRSEVRVKKEIAEEALHMKTTVKYNNLKKINLKKFKNI